MPSTGPEFAEPGQATEPVLPSSAPVPAPGPEATAALPTEPPLDPFARGTLGRRLVIRVAVLVALTAVLLSTMTALATRTLLLGSIDTQLDGVSSRAQRFDPGGQRGPNSQLLAPGQLPGSLAAIVSEDGSAGQGKIIAQDGDLEDLSGDALAALATVRPDQGKRTVIVPGLGRYRIVARDGNLIDRSTGVVTPGRAYWGLPLTAVDRQLAQLIGLELILTGLAIVGAVLASRAVVRTSLRPLNRVAAVAQQVSQLPLDRGEVALAVRVPP